jgi:hypothetical protein
LDLKIEFVQRLAAIGISDETSLHEWQQLSLSYGEDTVRRLLESREFAAAARQLWLPRLREYAVGHRLALPAPMVSDLDAADRERHRLLLTRMLEFAASADGVYQLQPCRTRTTIVLTTAVGLAAAATAFGSLDPVILTRDEWKSWSSKTCTAPDWHHRWYSLAHWELLKPADRMFDEIAKHSTPFPKDSQLWVLSRGTWHDGLSAHTRYESWRWDGRQAEFVHIAMVEVS